MTKLWQCGDTHGRFEHVIEAVLEAHDRGCPPDALIFLGDLECAQPLHIELQEIIGLGLNVWFIPGNHDTDSNSSWNALTSGNMADRNLHGRVETISGEKVAGLGGIFRSRIWAPPAEPNFRSYDAWRKDLMKKRPTRDWGLAEATEERRHKTTIFPVVFDCLAKQHADILVTHEATSCHPYGWEAIADLGRQMKVKWHFHGHLHDNQDYSAHFDRLGFQTYGIGYRGITELDLDSGQVTVIRPGDYDDQYFDWGKNDD